MRGRGGRIDHADDAIRSRGMDLQDPHDQPRRHVSVSERSQHQQAQTLGVFVRH
jgi:hypothetical protein